MDIELPSARTYRGGTRSVFQESDNILHFRRGWLGAFRVLRRVDWIGQYVVRSKRRDDAVTVVASFSELKFSQLGLVSSHAGEV